MFGWSPGLFFIFCIWMPLLIVFAILYGTHFYDKQKKAD
jgi:hypothetical protein